MTTTPNERELFEACLSLSIAERATYLRERCDGDQSLAARVERLLDAHEAAESEFTPPVSHDRIDGHEELTQIGPYRILEQIGEGGMGVVYTAEQKEPFRRLVALKVIKVGMDTRQVIARFEAERQALAMMDHPSIARVFDAGATESGRPYFVMEFVQGAPITQFCDARKMPIRDRLRLFMEVCDGVQHAHNRGVIHRDLKPSNVLVTSVDGRATAKIIDFGVAKATGAKLTAQTVHTAHGALIGTPAYMSPEQADGGSVDVDPRADVYALGVILYELCVGRPPFDALSLESGGLETMIRRIREERAVRPSTRLETREETSVEVAKRRGADVSSLRREISGDLDWIAMKALEKDRAARYASATELRSDIDRFLAQRTVLARPAPAATRTVRWLRRNALALALGATALTLALTRSPSTPDAPQSLLSVHVPRDAALYPSGSPNLAISPDGSTVAWVGGEGRHVLVRRLDSFEVRRLAGTTGAVGPFFSPDGTSIGFFADGALKRTSVTSGGAQTIVETNSTALASRGATWEDDGWIVFSPHYDVGLKRVREEGGAVEIVTTVDSEAGERTHRWPQRLPGGKAVLFTVDDDETQDFYDDASIVAHSLETGERSTVVVGASHVRYADGRIVFARGGSLYAQPFDPQRLRTTGPAVEAIEGVETDTSSGAAMFDLARDGTLVHCPGDDREIALDLVLRRFDGTARELDLEPGGYQQARMSPDGRRIAYVAAGNGGGDAWVYDIERRATTRLTYSGAVRSPLWSPDGERIYFGVNDGSLDAIEVDRSVEAEAIARTDRGGIMPVDFSANGQRIVAILNRPGLQWDIVEVALDSGEISDLVASEFSEGGVDLHPSKNWLAFASDRSGRREVYLTNLPDRDALYTVSSEGGMDAKWSPEGDAIHYLRPGTGELWTVGVDLGPPVTLEAPRLALSGLYAEEDVNHNFDVAPDGSILALRDGSNEEIGREIRVWKSWTRGL